MDTRILQLWSVYTLKERVDIIKGLFGERVKISAESLRRYYTMNGVKYRAAKKVYLYAWKHKEELDR